jgi:type I restriction enzyme S subunit
VKFAAEILPEYGFWWMRSLYNELREAAPQATLPIINQRRIGEFKIAIPPLSEQRRIVAYLDDLQVKVDALERLQAETAAELDALLPSVLDKAFKGEL